MLTVGEAIRQRRSIRSFRPDPVPEEYILEMLEAARLAPSGGNSQPWRFLVVTDTEEKKKLRQVAVDQEFVETAPVVFICAADMKAYSRRAMTRRFQEFVDFGILETLSGDFADPEYRKQYESRVANIDQATLVQMAVANTYIAIEHLVLTATALGLGSCWVGAVDQGEVRNFFNLPENVIIVALVPVGYPTKVPPLRPRVAMDEILLRPVGAVARA